MKSVQLDRSRLLGFRLDAQASSKTGNKGTSKFGTKGTSKFGQKGTIKPRSPQA